jgi:hypothetical protein
VQASNDAGVSSFDTIGPTTLTLPTVSVSTLLGNANFAGTDGHPAL